MPSRQIPAESPAPNSAVQNGAPVPVPLAGRLRSFRSGPLTGTVAIPGDKSISHRALMFGALALGETVVHGLLEGEDVLRTAGALRALGASVIRGEDGIWRTRGRGVGGLLEPAQVLDMGNSGTAARLLMGVLATHPFTSFMTGDASLNKRPMARVMTPLEKMGAGFTARSGGRFPLAVLGTATPVPIRYRLPVASAQVKSAILLAGLNAPGHTVVVEPEPTRDHSERMLRHFGVPVAVEPTEEGLAVTVTGESEMTGKAVRVPADPSSAAFPVVAALLRPGSELRLPGVGINERRTGLYQTLIEMGADIAIENRREEAGEPVADLVVRHSELKGVDVPADRAPSMIDEYPILAMAAACASGTTRMRGLAELRVKESDRLAMIAAGLAAQRATVAAGEDWLEVTGTGRPPAGGGAVIQTAHDHRIAMSFLVLGSATDQPVTIDDGSFIDTSFPGFVGLMNGLGTRIEAA